MSGEPTGVITIEVPGVADEVYSWNGVPEERAEAKARFEDVMQTRTYFAFVETSPGRAEQVRTFEEIEHFEERLGKATVTIQPALQGG